MNHLWLPASSLRHIARTSGRLGLAAVHAAESATYATSATSAKRKPAPDAALALSAVCQLRTPHGAEGRRMPYQDAAHLSRTRFSKTRRRLLVSGPATGDIG